MSIDLGSGDDTQNDGGSYTFELRNFNSNGSVNDFTPAAIDTGVLIEGDLRTLDAGAGADRIGVTSTGSVNEALRRQR